MSFPENLFLHLVTLIIEARLSICPNLVCTEKCMHDLGKAGQTTGVSYSTHGLRFFHFDCVLDQFDHIYSLGEIIFLLHVQTELYSPIRNTQASVSVVVLPTPVFRSRSSGCVVSASFVVSSIKCATPRKSTGTFITLSTSTPRVTSSKTSACCSRQFTR